MKVAVFGSTGETDQSIVSALLDSPEISELIALIRPSSLEKKGEAALRDRGVKITAADPTVAHTQIVPILTGIGFVICCVPPHVFDE
ncbi:hypothetical protein N7509_003037 [Penicillium cosmopolitanum]|uniref:NmrA-like domain-containing protein n=1 Tax=Penicillium cosmopolitanum TaxID=1131564 RepID=A0A9X0BAZ3_9EURO|nr:uncharacterized protein N7509_003037 [Penicillium cosmopolitanum]KAJ5403166.1 hypothetical protein N7509_003037 [Penicillium cosmopolitanum]